MVRRVFVFGTFVEGEDVLRVKFEIRKLLFEKFYKEKVILSDECYVVIFVYDKCVVGL